MSLTVERLSWGFFIPIILGIFVSDFDRNSLLAFFTTDTKIRIMADQPEWRIVFYVDENGNSPVEEFLRGLDIKTRTRFTWSLEQLRIRNIQAAEPLVKHLEGKLWEVRWASDRNIYRVLYFFFTGRQIVLLHGFQKKTEKTPRREIEVAEKRMESFILRKGGE